MASPPSAPQRPHTLTAHHHDRSDPWYWLRERDDPAVLAYLEAENAYTEEDLAPLAALRTSLFEEMKARILETDMSVPSRRGPWWYYGRSEEGKNYGIHCRRPAREAGELPPAGEAGDEEQILLDENVLAQGHNYFAVGGAAVSPDHEWLAFATDTDGDERYELQFRSVGGETPIPATELVRDTGYGLAWSSDATIIFYVRFDEAMRPHQLWRHHLGTDPAGDTLVFEEPDRRFSLGTGRTRDGAFVLVSLHSTNTAEWLAIPADYPLAAPRVIIPRREGHEYAVDHLSARAGGGHGWFVILTNDEALDFKVLAGPDTLAPEGGGWREIVAHRPGVRIEDVDAFSEVLVLSERAEAETQVRVLPLGTGTGPFTDDLLAGGWTIPSADSPSSTWLGANIEPEITSLRVGRTTMVTPSSVLQIELDSRRETLLKQEPVLGEFDPERYTTSRLWAEAEDGTRVPISLVHKKGITLPAPCLLYGYGAYEHSIDPAFSHHRLSLLDRGMVYAVAHVRGGGEMGRAWYENGRMEHKTNTFTDFIACARHLVSTGVADPGAVAGRGGSAGGLLIGAVANTAPELFRALVAQVPFVDVLTTMLDDQLPLTVGEWEEWGNPQADEATYNRMLAYSPYDNVSASGADGSARTYPDILATGGLNDPRVSYWEPAKWVAKLRVLSPSTKVLLKTELGAGHGGPSGRYDAWKEEAMVYAFLLNSLGMVPTD
ncbi:MAG TPA: S9 family peptidase [Acidimicrobiales bacterium]|jgi:oligopeptidase B|nr:S9 family peptidase [Acidimicrobiales bacterium]